MAVYLGHAKHEPVVNAAGKAALTRFFIQFEERIPQA